MIGKNLLLFLQTEIEAPKPYGIFHLSWCFAAIIVICLLCLKKNYTEKKLKWILGIYAIPAFKLEVLKQLIWSVEYNEVTNTFVWDFQWYAFPFQLCTTPIYIGLICLFLKKNKVRDYLLSFMGYTTILGSIATALIPHDVLVSDVLIDIHTMYLHIGSLIVSIYLLASKEIEVNLEGYARAIITFIVFIVIALIMNVAVYNSGILNGETFNMFYIRPYFDSSLPVFDTIYNSVPYPIFLIIYIVVLSLGSFVILGISYILEKIIKNKVNKVD